MSRFDEQLTTILDCFKSDNNTKEALIKIKKLFKHVEIEPPSEPLEVRLIGFRDRMGKYVDKYSRDMLNAFFRYYTTVSDRGKYKGFMLFEIKELDGKFSIGGRLATWHRENQKRSIANLVARKINQINR